MKYVDRSREYFLETGFKFPREIIWAMGIIKYASAWANSKLGLLSTKKADVIMDIAKKMADGHYDELITVDVYGTGSGTGLNMNVNEAISKVALDEYGVKIHPNDDVNKSQSSNDVVPTAVRMTVLKIIEEQLFPELNKFISSLRDISRKYYNVIKAGRTHLRDALPITFGLEFEGYLNDFELVKKRMEDSVNLLRRVPLGGTAVGTGFGAPEQYQEIVLNKINEISGLNLVHDSNKTRSMKLITDLVILSSDLKALALDLWRLSQDLRLMYSGPNTGISEIDMNIDIPGSSMMPGKKNPVTLEAVIQACIRIVGLDTSNTLSNLFGEFELALSFPLISINLIEQCKLLGEAIRKMYRVVLPNITIDEDRAFHYASSSLAILTGLTDKLGYDIVTKLVEEIMKGVSIEEALNKYGVSKREFRDLIKKMLGR